MQSPQRSGSIPHVDALDLGGVGPAGDGGEAALPPAGRSASLEGTGGCRVPGVKREPLLGALVVLCFFNFLGRRCLSFL